MPQPLLPPYPVWDLHCHITAVEGRTPEERMARLIEYADRMGVSKLILFLGTRLLADPTPDDLRRQNDEVLAALSHWHDRAYGFTYVSGVHVEESLAEMERCIVNGPMVGIKLWVARRCSDPSLDPIIRRAGELQAAIFQHTWYKAGGNLPGESSPEDLAILAARHPDVPMICGHTGGDWERGIRTIRPFPNVSIGTGGFDPTAGMMEMAVRELGPHRILYGSDVAGRSFASQLAKVLGADISGEAQRDILGGNLRRMLTPILNRKGLRP